MQLIRQIPHSLTLVAMLASTAYATNGVNLIGTGAISRAMGGTGVAFYSNPAEAISKNPALMEKTKNSETIQQFVDDAAGSDIQYYLKDISYDDDYYDKLPKIREDAEPKIAKCSENAVKTLKQIIIKGIELNNECFKSAESK